MTVLSTNPLSGPHVADGVNRSWPFSFKILDVSHMRLKITDADGSNEVIVTSGFTIAPNYLNNDAGGNVVYPIAPIAALTAGKIVRPYRDVPNTQPTKIGNQAGYFPQTHEAAFDLLAMQNQETSRDVDRAIKAPLGSAGVEFLAVAEGHIWKADASGNMIDGGSAEDIANAQAYADAAAASAALVDLGALDAAKAATAADVVLTHADVVLTHADALQTSADADATALDAAIAQAAQIAAENARDAAMTGARDTWPTTAAGIGSGIAGVTSIVAGSGGTNGTFALAYSGGTQVLAPVGFFTVAGGALVSVAITYPGYYSAGTPTLSFAASAGLTGASATAQMAANTPVNGYFTVPSVSIGEAAIVYKNVAGVATEQYRTPSSAVGGVLPLFSAHVSAQLYTPDTGAALPAGAKAPANYNNGGTWGTALTYFGTTGIISGLTVGQTYTVNIIGAPSGVTLSRAQGGFFWTPSNVFSSQVNHNGGTMNFATGDRSATFTAVTERASFNFVRSPSSDAMAPVFTSVLGALMVNAGATALPYEPQTPAKPLVPGPDFFPNAKLSDDVVVQHDGSGYFYARTSWDATYDKVQRFRFGTAPDLTANNLWDHHGERLIPIATAVTDTKFAFDFSTQITRSGVDESPPINLNSMWLAGGHGPLCRQLTVTGHGFVTGDIGSKWTDGVRNRILAQIVDANTVRFIAENTGTTTNWTISTAAVSGATLTWVSGGVATGTKTVAADILGQAYPFIRNRVGSVTLDGQDISAAGTYGGKCLRFSERYDIPNLARALDYIVANTTSGTNSLIHASIGAQIQFSMAHTLDWTGIVRTVWSPIDVETYTNGQYGGAQTNRPEIPAGGSLWAYVPKSKTFSGWDFASGLDISAWASTAIFTPAASYLSPSDPPDTMVLIAKDSGAVAKWGHFYALDNTVGHGKPAYRDDLTNGLLFTAVKKTYIIAGGLGGPAPVAGMVHETVNYVGTFPPSANPSLTWAVTYPKGGKHAVSMRSPGALTAQWVAIDPRLTGLPVTLTVSGGVATLLTEVVQDQGILMTFSNTGTAEVMIG